MSARIDVLTPEQCARMPSWADEWIARGLSCEPADREAWERGARACYAHAGIEWPGVVVWVGSPLVMALAAPIAAHLLRGGDDVVADVVAGAVDDVVGGAVRDAVSGAVIDAVADVVGGAVSDAVIDAVSGAVSGAVRQGWPRYLGGAWWLGWQAYESFFRDVCGLQLPTDQRAADYALAQQSAGWWWPHTRFVIACERPLEIHREQVRPRGWGSHQLHRADGPSIRFRDGWALYHWHGVQVPAEWILRPQDIDPAVVLREPNVERRTAGCQILGWGRILGALPHRVIDHDADPQYGDLLSVDLPNASDTHFLRAWCPAHQDWIVLGVPQDCTTAREAAARTYRRTAETYHPQRRT